MHTYTHQFYERSHMVVYFFRYLDYPIRIKGYQILHKTIKATCPELGSSKVVFSYIVILFHWGIWYHYDLVTHFYLVGTGLNNYTYRLMDECHRQLLIKYGRRTKSLIIPLVSVADRKKLRPYYDLVLFI